MKVMLGRRKHVEPRLLGQDDEFAQFLQHLLIALVVPANGTKTPAFFEGGRNRG
jgi:hypothetical protein